MVYSSSFRKPPTGPARSGRPDDKLRGYPESITTVRAEHAPTVIMDSGFAPFGAPRNDGAEEPARLAAGY